MMNDSDEIDRGEITWLLRPTEEEQRAARESLARMLDRGYSRTAEMVNNLRLCRDSIELLNEHGAFDVCGDAEAVVETHNGVLDAAIALMGELDQFFAAVDELAGISEANKNG